LYGTLATVATVALELELKRPVTRRKVESWCAALRTPPDKTRSQLGCPIKDHF
jgi:hypothetical protein